MIGPRTRRPAPPAGLAPFLPRRGTRADPRRALGAGRRADLVGREVVVDDRVAYFQFHKGQGFDELVLKRTPVVFRIPPRSARSSLPGPRRCGSGAS